MSPEERVREVYPQAISERRPNQFPLWAVYLPGNMLSGFVDLGYGKTEVEAWSRAAARLEGRK